MAVAEVAAAAMEHYYNKNIIHITKENYYAQIQTAPPSPKINK